MNFDSAFGVGCGLVLGIGFGVWLAEALFGVDLLAPFRRDE